MEQLSRTESETQLATAFHLVTVKIRFSAYIDGSIVCMIMSVFLQKKKRL